jgi:hypothetical protein
MNCKKGIIFSLDGAIAVSIVIIMLINTTYYFTTTSKESLSQTQIIKRGYDVIAMFDEVGDLENTMQNVAYDNIFISEIGSNEGGYGLNASYYLPPGYDMIIEIHDANKTRCTPQNCNTKFNEGGYYYVQINADVSNVDEEGGYFTIKGVETTRVFEDCNNCTFTTLEPIEITAGQGNNNFRIKDKNIGDSDVYWIKVLDYPGHIMTTNTTIHEMPTNRFIGTGERWFAANDVSGRFEGFHKVRFKIWVI